MFYHWVRLNVWSLLICFGLSLFGLVLLLTHWHKAYLVYKYISLPWLQIANTFLRIIGIQDCFYMSQIILIYCQMVFVPLDRLSVARYCISRPVRSWVLIIHTHLITIGGWAFAWWASWALHDMDLVWFEYLFFTRSKK